MNPVSDVSRFYAAGNVKMRLQSRVQIDGNLHRLILSTIACSFAGVEYEEKGETISGASKVKCFWVDSAKWSEGMTFCTHELCSYLNIFRHIDTLALKL